MRNTVFEATDYRAPDMARWDLGWEQCYRDFLAHLDARSHSLHTARHYAGLLTRFFNDARLPPPEVTRRDVEAFASRPTLVGPMGAKYYSKQPVAARTRNNRIAVISSFYDYANAYERFSNGKVAPLTDRNPATSVGFAKESPTHRTMTESEFKQFISAIPKDTMMGLRDRAMFLCLFWTCRRRAEVCALTWGDIREATFVVDAKKGTLRPGWTYTFRNKGGTVYTAELPAPAMQAIQEYITVSGRQMEPDSPLFEAIGPQQGGFVHDPYLGITPNGLYERMRVYLRAAGMDEHAFSPHSLRHSGALARYRAGSGVLEIMRTLNHQNLKTSQIYLQELSCEQDSGSQLLMERYGGL